jgi:hypothetical protein
MRVERQDYAPPFPCPGSPGYLFQQLLMGKVNTIERAHAHNGVLDVLNFMRLEYDVHCSRF